MALDPAVPESGALVEAAMLGMIGEGTSQVIVTNPMRVKYQLEGAVLGETSPVELVVSGTDTRCILCELSTEIGARPPLSGGSGVGRASGEYQAAR